ncbi:sulfurtransferase [Streptacidiphilus jiangxiensis]|uniref:Sulfurtransferase n=1 Tax=Streptacidiphilus jiangxiensis TaxID=235985 RepID=A0A1H7KSN6_STRJI|nr:sulfurtransferase [Streptacidiphilus jiangxiensis]SEK89821.1 thiosulfate/3-mercaptopyruvate sulfurtransferase [Streptacidiphilus jiangxiensis]
MTQPASLLIGPDDLAALLTGEHPPAVLDIRWSLGGPPGAEEYAKGHVPGAHYVDLDRELASAPGTGGRHPLPTPEVLQAALRRAGVRADREVVVYDAATSMSAARAWWLLRWAGHGHVRVLDGGLQAWTEAGHPLSLTEPEAESGDFTVVPGSVPTIDADGAASWADGHARVLLDARAGERYRGETEPVDPRAGHIPGATSAPTSENVDATGRFLPAADLAARFRALGAREDTEIAVYCGSGVTAAHEALALELAGLRATLYPGSWSEWSADPSRPAATGPDPR